VTKFFATLLIACLTLVSIGCSGKDKEKSGSPSPTKAGT
jgi:hypothetical protein